MAKKTRPARQTTVAMSVLVALSATHFLNDVIQSLVQSIYPIIKDAYHLDYLQIGFITFTFQVSASLFQPAIGHYTDKNPTRYAMIVGMGFSLAGLVGLAYAASYPLLLVASAFVGIGSSIFHPEATRLARHASGGKQGLAQGIFQLGGTAGSALGPLLAAFIIVPRGQSSLSWFAVVALAAMVIMAWIATRSAQLLQQSIKRTAGKKKLSGAADLNVAVALPITILVILMFSKNAYTQSFSSFYTFYLMTKFDVSIQTSQIMLFVFLASSAAGALGGSILGDYIGRERILWVSILGALPFTLMLPFASLFWTGVLTVIITLIMSSSFASILVYAMELLPHRAGLVGGFFYGLAFGLAGIAAAVLGAFADRYGIEAVYFACSFIPALGLLVWFLPRLKHQ